MTEKQMRQLTEMIIEAIDNKQRELDKEFYANIDNRTDIAYSPHPVDQAKQWAIMYCDHSHEIIVRHVSDVKYIGY